MEAVSAQVSSVLVGFADQDSSDALEYAAQEAIRTSVPLRILHAHSPDVFYPWGYGYPLPAGDMHMVEETARNNAVSLLADAAERVRDRHPGLQVITVLAIRSAAAALVRASRGASTLVVGKRNRRGRHSSMGSVSLAVAAHAACPVVVVPSSAGRLAQGAEGAVAPTSAERAPGQVVVGLEDSPECADALGFAFAQATARDTGLTVVHAWWVDPDVLSPALISHWEAVRDTTPMGVDAALAPWKDRYPDVKVTVVIAHAEPMSALLAQAHDSELLVVGGRGRGGFASLMLGSVSRKVLQHADCPVAVVRRSHTSP
jgi:nucleotide-binding universal stress UspA family protein